MCVSYARFGAACGGRGQAYRIQFKRQAVEWHFASCFDSRSHNASKIGRLDNIYLGPITGGKRDVDRSVVVRSGTSSFGRPPSTRSASVNPSPEDEASCRLERLSCSTRWRHPSHQLREVAIINSPPAAHRILGVFIVNQVGKRASNVDSDRCIGCRWCNSLLRQNEIV